MSLFLYILLPLTIVGLFILSVYKIIYYSTHQYVLQKIVQEDIHGIHGKTLEEHINEYTDDHKFNPDYFHKNYDKVMQKELQKIIEKKEEKADPIDNRKLDVFEKRRQENSQLLQRFRDQYLN